jgi:hypothetical protein
MHDVGCPFCERTVEKGRFVYCIEGFRWRCWECIRQLARTIAEMRQERVS